MLWRVHTDVWWMYELSLSPEEPSGFKTKAPHWVHFILKLINSASQPHKMLLKILQASNKWTKSFVPKQLINRIHRNKPLSKLYLFAFDCWPFKLNATQWTNLGSTYLSTVTFVIKSKSLPCCMLQIEYNHLLRLLSAQGQQGGENIVYRLTRDQLKN